MYGIISRAQSAEACDGTCLEGFVNQDLDALAAHDASKLPLAQNAHYGTEHKLDPPFDQPYSFFIAELFKIVDGKFNRFEALVTPVPHGMPTGWMKK
jgi:hypothetical protein